MITIEDVLEQIVGQIEDEHDVDTDNIIAYQDNRFLIKADATLIEFNTYFQTQLHSDNIDTIAGWLVHQMGHLPQQHEEFRHKNLLFRVLKTNSRRIKLLEIHLINDSQQEENTPEDGG